MKPLWWMRGPLMEAAGEGTGGGGGDAFDPAKFQTALMAEVNKAINGAIKNVKAELAKKPAEGEGTPPPEPEPEPKPGDKTDPKVKALEKKLADLATKYDAEAKARQESDRKAEEKDRISTLRTELGKVGIQPDRIDSALRIFGPDVKRAEDGSLTGADDTPLGEFLTTQIKNHEYLLPAKQVGGAGATAGGRRAQPVDLNDIKPGMKADDLARVREEIARVAAEAMRG